MQMSIQLYFHLLYALLWRVFVTFFTHHNLTQYGKPHSFASLHRQLTNPTLMRPIKVETAVCGWVFWLCILTLAVLKAVTMQQA
ncbi:hypothetical protein FKM82_019710 [Ascaphus truei]